MNIRSHQGVAMLERWRNRRSSAADRVAVVRVVVADALVAQGFLGRDADLQRRLHDPDDDVTLSELGLDSLALLALAIDLDRTLGVEVSVDDLSACRDLRAVCDLVISYG